jgi:hypothetical protein
MQIIDEIKSAKDLGYRGKVKSQTKIEQFSGTSESSVEGTVHSTTEDEKIGFVDWYGTGPFSGISAAEQESR